jgi:hypothetical protein
MIMDIIKAKELHAKGITILRPGCDPIKGWKINKLSFSALSHGWKRFGGNWYLTESDCRKSIDRICSLESNKCIRVEDI